ncbi:hypothetical protein KIW84_043284 [Lathyrus oleraceus]|uniref:Uncharacterized protein n=1 Tax=Pisum sativum TaxID=3888 RepID=A0A9D4XD75_PEA|nr:hypothetical protein KIW84_043284 [Pisum sativum]
MWLGLGHIQLPRERHASITIGLYLFDWRHIYLDRDSACHALIETAPVLASITSIPGAILPLNPNPEPKLNNNNNDDQDIAIAIAMAASTTSLPFFKPEPDNFYNLNSTTTTTNNVVPFVSNPNSTNDNFLMHQNTNTMDSISNPHPFFHNNNNYFFNNSNSNNNPFEMGFENGFFMGNNNNTNASNSPVFMGASLDLTSASEFPPTLELDASVPPFSASFSMPLELSQPQPQQQQQQQQPTTLFQKRRGALEIPRLETVGNKKKRKVEKKWEEDGNGGGEDDVEDFSELNYDSDENGNDLNNSNGTVVTGGDQRGRRRRGFLPKISWPRGVEGRNSMIGCTCLGLLCQRLARWTGLQYLVMQLTT